MKVCHKSLVLLIGFALLVGLSGCLIDETKPYVDIPYAGKINYQTIVIEGCEYLYFPAGNGSVMSHKGNCNNPIHLYRVER